LDRVALSKVNVQGSGNSALHSKHNKNIFISIYFLYSLARLGEERRGGRSSERFRVQLHCCFVFLRSSTAQTSFSSSLFYSFTSCFSSPHRSTNLTLNPLSSPTTSSPFFSFDVPKQLSSPFFLFLHRLDPLPSPILLPSSNLSSYLLVIISSANNHGLPIKSHLPPPNHHPLHRSSRRSSSPLLPSLLLRLSTLRESSSSHRSACSSCSSCYCSSRGASRSGRSKQQQQQQQTW